MKSLSKCITAGAAALLASAGLASPAFAAHEACAVAVDDVRVVEGDTGTTALKFTITATEKEANGCDGAVVNYTFANGTATRNTDYAAADGAVTLAAGTTQNEVTVAVTGEDVVEPDETFFINLTEGAAAANDHAVLTDAQGQGTIASDDTISSGGTATIDPKSGRPGTTITVTATGCTATNGRAVLVQTRGESGGPLAEDDTNAVTDGTFKATLTVPNNADPSATQFVRAFCGDDPGEAYPDVAFDVLEPMTGGNGYRMVAADGGIFTFGQRNFHGSTGNLVLNKPIVGGATDTSDFDGYWIVASDGGVFAFSAGFYGSLGDRSITSPATEIEPTSSGRGYWIVQADGTVTTFGDAKHFGDMKGRGLSKPVIGMAVTPTGQGYWLVGEDGGIFNFGDARFFGSMGATKLNAPVVDLAPAVDNKGYYLLGGDGGVFSFGSADFKGSTGGMKLNAPVVAMLVNPTGSGYWLAATDGGIFTFGAVDFLGSMGGVKLNSPVLDLIN